VVLALLFYAKMSINRDSETVRLGQNNCLNLAIAAFLCLLIISKADGIKEIK